MTAMPTPQHGATLDFPRVTNSVSQPAALREEVMRITVTRDGKFYFHNTATALADLVPLITAASQQGAERTIYLAADLRARNIDVEAAIDQIQKAGITKVTILTEQFHPESPAIDARF
jgi:biopolymer transport protein ExbD